jgi:hypothetical protein
VFALTLTVIRHHFVVGLAIFETLNLLRPHLALIGEKYSHHCHISGLLASGVPIVPQLATIFMLR